LQHTEASTNIRHMSTKKRPSKKAPARTPEGRACDRFNDLYQWWRKAEQREGRSASLTGFAHELGYDSHSAVGDMLNGRRALSADVLRAARAKWAINPDWLLGYDGPRYSFNVLTEGTLEEMLGARVLAHVAARIEAEPIEGRGIASTRSPLELAEGAGVRLVALVVDAAEEALRASYPFAVAASLEERAVADAVARVATDSSEANIYAASIQAAVGQALKEARRLALQGVPLAASPPVRIAATP
jgi:hypothetical protein